MIRAVACCLLAVAFFSGCVLPIRSEDMPAVLDKLSQSSASACVVTGASGGAGMIAVTPAPVPGGGWGNANFIFCRSNEPGSKITANASGLTIDHGSTGSPQAAVDELKEKISTLETAVKYLLQKLLAAAKPEALF